MPKGWILRNSQLRRRKRVENGWNHGILAPMSLLPFEQLPPYRPRAFVPEKIDLGDWSQVAPLFDRLETAAPAAKRRPIWSGGWWTPAN